MRLIPFFVKSATVALIFAGVCVAQQSMGSACPIQQAPAPVQGTGASPQNAGKLCPFLPATPQTPGHPHPQPRPPASQVSVTQEDGICVARITTAHGCFAESNPYQNPPGTNFLQTDYENAFDGNGKEMPNTLPSRPKVPYNLHDGKPVVSALCGAQSFEECKPVPESDLYEIAPNLKYSPKSPSDDLVEIFDQVDCKIKPCRFNKLDPSTIARNFQRGIDILEGNPIRDRLYSGLPLLHFKGPEKVQQVTPILDGNGSVIGGNVSIHQVWYDTHIESDVAFIDPTPVKDVPWTITYTIDVLSRGNDDFSPFTMYFDDPALSPPGMPPMPHIAMDQTFFNMEEGTRTVFKIKMAPGKYYNLTYNWGWRAHPPRVQVTENANKKVMGKTLVQWEQDVFGGRTKEEAIAQIGDLAPEKRMWQAFRDGKQALAKGDYRTAALKIDEARAAFVDWRERAKLPRGVNVDKNSDLTVFYVNNTMYAEFKEGNRSDFPKWMVRGTTLKVTLINGDYFAHGYQNVDFGGARGWENQFQSSVESGGSGPWFTFGRVHWWMNIPMFVPDENNKGQMKPFGIVVPAATHSPNGKDTLQRYKVEITYEYEPSRRLRFYQFDPMHHDVAIFSVH